MTRLTPSEHDIQSTIVAWLRMIGYCPVKITNEGKRGVKLAAMYRAEGLHAGAADLVVPLDDGLSLWVECKTAAGRLSPEQKAFRVMIEARGHRYILARCLEDVMEALL